PRLAKKCSLSDKVDVRQGSGEQDRNCRAEDAAAQPPNRFSKKFFSSRGCGARRLVCLGAASGMSAGGSSASRPWTEAFGSRSAARVWPEREGRGGAGCGGASTSA